jgi:uncharacterized protein YkwD
VAAGVLMAALLLGSFAANPYLAPARAGVSYSPQEVEFVRLINEYREQHGRGRLLVSDAMSLASKRHSADMGTFGFFGHVTAHSNWFSAGSTFDERLAACGYGDWNALAENIAAGQSSAARVFAVWRASSGHNENMLNSRFRVMGVGFVGGAGPDGSYWTTDFGDTVDASSHELTAEPGPYPDVPAYHAYADAVRSLSEEGVVGGYADGLFRPEEPLLRQQFAKMIVGSLRIPVSEADICPFGDVESSGPNSLYPENFVAAAARSGVTEGTAVGLFSPKAEVTRAQVVTMAVRAARALYPGRLKEPLADYDSTWRDLGFPHQEAARWAQYNGLLDGLPVADSRAFGAMSRGEVAQLLCNLERKLGL